MPKFTTKKLLGPKRSYKCEGGPFKGKWLRLRSPGTLIFSVTVMINKATHGIPNMAEDCPKVPVRFTGRYIGNRNCQGSLLWKGN